MSRLNGGGAAMRTARPFSALTRATAASIMTLASSKESDTGTSIRGRAANISPAGADCSCAVTAESMSAVVIIVMKGIININVMFDRSDFC